MRWDGDWEHTEVLEVWQGLGFSLCAVPLDTYCPQIVDEGGEVRTMSSRDNQCRFQTEEHTWSLECIYIGIGYIRVTRIGHISGLGFGDQKIEQGGWKCKVERKHETKRGLGTWNAGGNRIHGWMSKRSKHDDEQNGMDGIVELAEVPEPIAWSPKTWWVLGRLRV